MEGMGLAAAFLMTGGVYFLTALSPLAFPAWRGMDEGAAVGGKGAAAGKGTAPDKGAVADKSTAPDKGAVADKSTAPDKGAAPPLSSAGPIRPTAAPAEPTPHP
ncbi:hypothetical protein ACH4GZ_25970 [Streptomyces hygroscopicus]|uniref:hypothetical protein n=1 Tax=Streptomyces hygroscopicus TaxID=1912 RepID=UPI0037A18ACC